MKTYKCKKKSISLSIGKLLEKEFSKFSIILSAENARHPIYTAVGLVLSILLRLQSLAHTEPITVLSSHAELLIQTVTQPPPTEPKHVFRKNDLSNSRTNQVENICALRYFFAEKSSFTSMYFLGIFF